MDLCSLHEQLGQHFKALADDRGGASFAPYLLEHPLTEAALAELVAALPATLRAQPLADDEFWNTRYLGLLVALAENSYWDAKEEPWCALWPAVRSAQAGAGVGAARKKFESWIRLEVRAGRLAPSSSKGLRYAWLLDKAEQEEILTALRSWLNEPPGAYTLSAWLPLNVTRLNPYRRATPQEEQQAAIEDDYAPAGLLVRSPLGAELAAALADPHTDVGALAKRIAGDLVARLSLMEQGRLDQARHFLVLNTFQARLEGRYQALKMERQGAAPVYAIEHGLTEAELQKMKQALRDSGETLGSLASFWLCLVALGAEVAFDYEDSFWSEFFNEINRKGSYDQEKVLSSYYSNFCSQYDGPKSVGSWATTFNLISWPVANAVCAKVFRRNLTELVLAFATSIEDRIEDAAFDRLYFWKILTREFPANASARFCAFLDDRDLVEFSARCLVGVEATDVQLDIDLQRRILEALQRELDDAHQSKMSKDLARLRAHTGGAGQASSGVQFDAENVDGRWFLQATLPTFEPKRVHPNRLPYITVEVDGFQVEAKELAGRPLRLTDHRFSEAVKVHAAPKDKEDKAAVEAYFSNLSAPKRLLLRQDPDDPTFTTRCRSLSPGSSYLVLTTRELGAPWRRVACGTEGLRAYDAAISSENLQNAASVAGLPRQGPPPVRVWMAGRPRQEELQLLPGVPGLLAVCSDGPRRISLVVEGRSNGTRLESPPLRFDAAATRCLRLPPLVAGDYDLRVKYEIGLAPTRSLLRVEAAAPRPHSGGIHFLPGPGLLEVEHIEDLAKKKVFLQVAASPGVAATLRLSAHTGEDPQVHVGPVPTATDVVVVDALQAALPGAMELAWKVVLQVEAEGRVLWTREFDRNRDHCVRWVEQDGAVRLVDQRGFLLTEPPLNEPPPPVVIFYSEDRPWQKVLLPHSTEAWTAAGLYKVVVKVEGETISLPARFQNLTGSPFRSSIKLPPAKDCWQASRAWLNTVKPKLNPGAMGNLEFRRRCARVCTGALAASLMSNAGPDWFEQVELPAEAGTAPRHQSITFPKLLPWAREAAPSQTVSQRLADLGDILNVPDNVAEALLRGLTQPSTCDWAPDESNSLTNLGDWVKRLLLSARTTRIVQALRLAILWSAEAAREQGVDLKTTDLYHGWGRDFWR